MKLKKFIAMIFALSILTSLSACDDKKQATTDSKDIASETVVAGDDKNETTEKEVETEISNKDDFYSNKVYNVGDDIPEDTYAINCTSTEYGMEVIVFSSKEDYTNFQNAEKITNGEYQAAIENHAWADFYLENNETAYIKLNKGNLILLDDGKCEFNKHDTSDSNTLYSGIYMVGEDINNGHVDIKCVSEYLQVTIFENKEKYLEYHKSSRFTVGEESEAIDKYSESSEFIYSDNMTSVHLQDGMVLMIDDGIGEYSTDDGPIVN
ncbi:MAG: hypothetical protein IJX24_05425 [Oscillospiraceae bacterium]|nr:hypothetical protein [Oscillospiraceae bacterium]